MVVDECDSTMGCDSDHDFQPPCPNNIVDASKAVWKALGVPEKDWGELDITWSDAQENSRVYLMYINATGWSVFDLQSVAYMWIVHIKYGLLHVRTWNLRENFSL